jgi:formiminotetrahydrofolate cyclodeaminase
MARERIVRRVPYADLTIAEFSAELGRRTPAPAGGSAIAVAAALAAGLVELTARFSDEDGIAADAVQLRDRLLALADEDADAFAEYMQTHSDETWSRTVDVPLALAQAAAAVAQLAERLERTGNPRLLGDAAAATFIARATVRAAARLVEINLEGRADARGERARELAAEAAAG